MKFSPVHDAALRLGAIVGVDVGWSVPIHYANRSETLCRVALLDESAHGKIMIHGRAGDQALAALGLVAPVEIGRGRADANIAVYQLRADQLFISAPTERATAICTVLTTAKTKERVTVTDVTHGRAQLRLVGPASAELLSRLCGLDLAPHRIPDHSAHQTSVAKTTQLVLRSDLPGSQLSYVLIGARSLGEYLWQALLAAGSDLGIQPIGIDDLPTPAD